MLAAAGAAGFLLYQNVFSGSREDVLEEYMACIEKGDYEKLYTFLDSSSQELVSQEDFVTRNQNIYEGIEVSDIQLEIPKDQDRGKPLSYSVTMDTIGEKFPMIIPPPLNGRTATGRLSGQIL